MRMKVLCKNLRKTFNSIFKLLKFSYRLSPQYVWYTILASIISTAKALSLIFIPAQLVDAVSKSLSFTTCLVWIAILTVTITVADASEKALNLQRTALGYRMNNNGTLAIGQKGMKNDFQYWDIASYMNKNYQAVTGTWIFMGVCDVVYEKLLSAVISIIMVAYIIAQINIYILIILILLVIIGVLFEKKNAYIQHEITLAKSDAMKKKAYNENIIFDLRYGKELRAYGASSYIIDKYASSSQKVAQYEKNKSKNNLYFQILSLFLTFLESFIVYLFSVYQYLKKQISLGYIVSYYGAIIQLKKSIDSLFEIVVDLKEIEKYYTDIQSYFDMNEEMRKGRAHISEREKSDFFLELKNVSFYYPETNKEILKNVNLQIHSNERIAIVGENGSGKTTLVKLILRLYDVSSGKILLNGKNIKEYDYNEYLSLVAPVFQDFQLHAFSIQENISFADKGEEYIWKLLSEYELADRIKQLKNGLDTYLTKLLDENGTDFSGGENQKIAMVRAAYKNASLLVLDEPTANIDPLSEKEFFEKIDHNSKNKSVVFISHRLSSAKISDKIVVLENGEVIEEGSFKDLIEHNGKFFDMFHVQSSLYNTKDL